MIVDPAEHVGEPSLRVGVIQLGGLDQGEHRSGARAAAIGAGEQPRAAPEGNTSQGAFSGVVGQADLPVIEKLREGRPALQNDGVP